KGETLDVALRGNYSTSEFNFRDSSEGFFQRTDSWLTRLGFTAERASEGSQAWYLQQTAGRDWSNPANWNLDDDIGNNVRNNESDARNRQTGLNLDVKKELEFGGHPFTLLTGLGTRTNDWETDESHYQQYQYVGPNGDLTQRDPAAAVPWTEHYQFGFLNLDAGNVDSQGWRADNNYAMYEIYKAHPDWFVPDTVGNLKRVFDNNKRVRETVNAAYVEGQTRWGDARFDLGLRYEQTETEARTAVIRPASEGEAAGLSTSTVEGLCYQYHCVDGKPTDSTQNGRNDYYIYSVNVIYDSTEDQKGQRTFISSILPTAHGILGGIVHLNDNTAISSVPNSRLRPEHWTKSSAGPQYYFE